jgi:predicted permease
MSRLWTVLFRAALRTFPPAFRERFGVEMEEHFLDVMTCRSGPKRMWTGWSALGRLAGQGMAERFRPTLSADRNRERRRWGVEGWIRDLRLAARALARRPAYAVVAGLTIALGIGANTAIFSLIHGVLLTPLDYPDPDGLVFVGEAADRPGLVNSISAPEVYALEEIPSLDAVAGVRGARMTLTGFGPAEAVVGALVTRGLLGVFHLEPALGRDLRPEEGRDEGVRRIVLSHRFWTDRLGADPDAVGRLLTLDGESWEVVGVAPEGWAYPSNASYWAPGGTLEGDCFWGCNLFRAVGRLAPGATLEGARAEALALSTALEADHPDQQTTRRFDLGSLHERVVGQARDGLWLLLGAVGVVLLIACANVANLLLVRAQNRRGEVAVRRALGASRGRLVREVLTESMLLAGAGGLLGALLAAGVLQLLPALAGGAVPRLDEVALDGPVLAFTAGAALFTVLVAGLLPALRVSRGAGALGSRHSPDRRDARSRNLLLSAEVGLSLVLLVAAGLLLRTFAALSRIDPGFATEDVVRFDVSLPDAVYDEADDVLAFADRLETTLEALPGVEAAALGMGTPLTAYSVGASLTLMDRPEPPDGEEANAAMRVVTPGYLELQDIRLLRGRGFSGAERNGEPSAYLVNETFVRRYLREGEDPIGIPLRAGVSFGFGREPGEIVGVVEDVRAGGLGMESEPEFYAAFSQYLPTFFTVNVRTVPGAVVGEAEIRSALAVVDPDVPLFRLSTVEEAIREELAPSRFYLALVGAFAGLALVLSAVGLYGVVAYAVARRTREIGVRVALGADRDAIRRLVLTEGLRPTLLGLAGGVLVALLGARAIRSLLYGVEPLDPVTFAVVPLLLLGVAVLAILAPARRATREDPVEALRGE